MFCDHQNRVAIWSGKTKEKDKSQVKMRVFEKSQEKKNHQILLVQKFSKKPVVLTCYKIRLKALYLVLSV